MKYLICQDWANTSNNHAGMKHMCNLLKKNYPHEYEVIVFPDMYVKLSKSKQVKRIQILFLKKVIIPYKYLRIGKVLSKKLVDNDSIYLLEYCEKLTPQIELAKYIKKKKPIINIFGLVHLVPDKLDESFTKAEMQKWIQPLDGILTFGTSLSNYFIYNQNVPAIKVRTIFHYVDDEYYKPIETIVKPESIGHVPKVLVMGNQKRNFELLLDIVKYNPAIHFTICQGVVDLKPMFKGCHNVDLIGFIEEAELLGIMQESDISLNIMYDTIGSNVIVTSMAVGMAMIVSDVGSIRDYCKVDGAIYCDNENINLFSSAIKELFDNEEYLLLLKAKSLQYSKNLSIKELHAIL